LEKEQYNRRFIKLNENPFPLSFMAPISLYLLDKTRLMDRFPNQVAWIHHKIMALYGRNHGFAYTRLFIAQLLSFIIIVCFLTVFFLLLSKDILLLYYGIILMIFVPVFLIKGLKKKFKKKQEQMIMELPVFVNKVALLINAGETVQQAIIRSMEQKQQKETSYLYQEIRQSVHEIKNNVPFQQVLEDLSRRCGLQEVSIFTTTVLLNYRRGGDRLVTALNLLSKELWEKRKAMSRTLGEQASAKLVFPMVLIFLIVLIIIAAPAIMMF